MNLPHCMLDEFTRRFFHRFSTVPALLGKRARGALAGLAEVLKDDICAIECRNAAIKRCLRSRSATHPGELPSISGDFLMQRQRVLERLFHRQAASMMNSDCA